MKIFKGNFVFSKSKDELVEFSNGYLLVDDEGIIVDLYKEIPTEYKALEAVDLKGDVVIPSFSDLHVHAPQYPNRGIAMDKLLADWLNDYTFPLESKYKDPEFAKAVYSKFVDNMIKQGTMHAVVFGTIHNEATNILAQEFEKRGIMARIGKVNMDKDSQDYLIETTDEAVKNAEKFILENKDNKYAKPIITPRFAPTCTFELNRRLGDLSNKYKIGVQTHIVESLWEAEECKKNYKGCKCDMEIYDKANLINQAPFVAAHYVFPSQEDIDLMLKCGGYAVTCPDATTNVIAGIMRTGYLLDLGMNLGIGSDISAGSYLGIYTQVASVVRYSKYKYFYEPKGNREVLFKEAFYMGTKSGGSLFGKVGSFEKGYYFDALVLGDLQDSFREISLAELVERFCYSGDVTNIKRRILRGKDI